MVTFDMMVERMDKNGNGAIERQELNRGGPAMSAVAGRYVERLGVDVDAELDVLVLAARRIVGRIAPPVGRSQPPPVSEPAPPGLNG